jgi:hypothetical protein
MSIYEVVGEEENSDDERMIEELLDEPDMIQ